MIGNVKLSGESDGPSILPAHDVEPLELYAEDQGRPLYLVLLVGGDLLQALLALVRGVSPLAQALPSEVATEGHLNIVGLPGRK